MRHNNVVVAAAAAISLAALAAGSIGCAPTAGLLRPEHPLLLDEQGRPALAPTEMPVVFDDPVPSDGDDVKTLRNKIAAVAAQSVGKGPIVVAGARYRMDCSGVASGIYEKAGVDIGAGKFGGYDVHTLFQLVKRSGGSLRRANPLPGDFVFFDDTYDANENGLRDDPLSHVGVVEKVDDDGTVLFVHRIGKAIVRYRMNLGEPHLREKDGKVLNHYLRAAHGAEPAKTSAELFVAYGSLPLTSSAPLVASR